MAAAIIAALFGASVDTGVMPPMVHALLGYGAVVANIAALKTEIEALGASSRIVNEVNRLLGA
jgi:hypothetical protein